MTMRVSKNQGTHTAYTARHEQQLKRHARRPSPIERVNVVSASGSTETLPDVDVATMHRVTLTANCALTFPAAGAGKSFSLELVQDGTGSRTVTWPGSVKWDGGATPILSTAANAVDTLWFICFDGSRWEAGVGGLGHA